MTCLPRRIPLIFIGMISLCAEAEARGRMLSIHKMLPKHMTLSQKLQRGGYNFKNKPKKKKMQNPLGSVDRADTSSILKKNNASVVSHSCMLLGEVTLGFPWRHVFQ